MSSPLDYIACVSGEHHGHALTALLAQGDPPTKTGLWCDSWVVYPAERALDALISNGEKIGHAALIESRDSVASQRSRSEVIPHYDRSGQTFPVILPRPLVPSRRGGKTGTESAAGAVRSFEAQVGEAAVPAAGEVPALSTGFSPAVPDPKKKRGD